MIDKLKVMKKSVLFVFVGFFLLGLSTTNVNAQGFDYGSDPEECKKNYSLYKEYYEQKNYDAAYPFWKKTVDVCPKLTKFLYKHGATLIEHRMNKVTDEAAKKALLDSLMWNYDTWIANFGEDGGIYGDKGVDAYKNELLDIAYEALKKSIELDKNESTANPINYYFFAVRDKVKNGSLDTTAIFDAYDVLTPIIDHRLGTVDEKYKKYYEAAKTNVENTFIPFATCEVIVKIFGKRINENPSDAELMKKTLRLMEIKDCTDNPMYGDVAKKLYALEPSAEAASAIARKELKAEKVDEAIKYYNEAIKLQTNEEDKAQLYYELAQIQYAKKKAYAEARTLAQKAIATRSGWGKPYLLIGDLYLYTSGSCGDNECNKKYGIWAAEDKYIKAKSVDPSVAEDANSKIGKCRGLYPTSQDCFFYGIKEGQEVQVGGWIGETTKARF